MRDMLLRVAALIIASVGAALTGLLAAFLVPLHIGSVRFPISLVIVVLGNVLAVSFAHRVAGFRWGALAPAVAWLVVTLPLGSARAEGDIVLANDWVSLLTVLFGGAALAFAVFFTFNPVAVRPVSERPREGTRRSSLARRISPDGRQQHTQPPHTPAPPHTTA